MAQTKNTIQLALVASLIAALAGCSSAKTEPAAPNAAAQAVEVRVDPSSVTIARGAATQLDATVTGMAVSTVAWSIDEPGTVGTVTQTGLYTAPATASGTFHVRATSTVDKSFWGEAAVTVAPPCTSFTYSAWGACTGGTQTRTVASSVPTGCMGGASPVLTQSCTTAPVAVSLSPKTTSMDACTQTSFTATVSNTTNHNVTWSVQEVGGGSVASGVYTAPSMAGTYHVVATSVVDPTAIDTATVTVGDKVLSVTVAPTTATLAQGGTQQFVATIRTTCTTYTSSTQ